jgi:hypothetical protein
MGSGTDYAGLCEDLMYAKFKIDIVQKPRCPLIGLPNPLSFWPLIVNAGRGWCGADEAGFPHGAHRVCKRDAWRLQSCEDSKGESRSASIRLHVRQSSSVCKRPNSPVMSTSSRARSRVSSLILARVETDFRIPMSVSCGLQSRLWSRRGVVRIRRNRMYFRTRRQDKDGQAILSLG